VTVFDELESNVRYYCRQWPAMFAYASGATLVDDTGSEFIDFFSGAGALSYGHNNPRLVEVAIEHLSSNRIAHCLDTHTPEKGALLESLRECVLEPRGLDMVVQFVGPTGATAVEAALKLAAKVTGRHATVAYEGGYHGMSAGAASVSGALNQHTVDSVDHPCVFLPFVDRYSETATSRLDVALQTPINGRLPGALIIEATQGEGGARSFDTDYLSEVRKLCTRHGVIIIADEVQAGVGRTGPFFSFEGSALDPDIVCLSKSLSGLGLPLAVNLIRRNLDQWAPGEFTGTFRGNNMAFSTANAMLQLYWRDEILTLSTLKREQELRGFLRELADNDCDIPFTVRGRGLLMGMDFDNTIVSAAISDAAFRVGLVVETCGPRQATVKLLPPLLIADGEFAEGLDRLGQAFCLVHDELRLSDSVVGVGQ